MEIKITNFSVLWQKRASGSMSGVVTTASTGGTDARISSQYICVTSSVLTVIANRIK